MTLWMPSTRRQPEGCSKSLGGRAYLVRAEGEAVWWMGQLDGRDGSIRCWGRYSSDLEAAIRGL